MKLKVQLVVCADDGREEQVQEVATLAKDCQRIEHLGLTLAEAKQLLATLQQALVAQQASAFVATCAQCDHCGATLRTKGQQTRTFRTLFGTVMLTCPQALKDFLPVDTTLNATTVQNHTLAVAQRCEDELGEEQWAFVDGCPATWETLPIPDGPITVGIDGGYVRDWDEKKRQFEVIVGKSILAFKRDDEEDIPSSKCFGFVQTLATKPKRRLFEVLQS